MPMPLWRCSRSVPFSPVSLLCILILLLSASGCEKATAWRPGQPLAKEKIKIGVIHVDDASLGYSYAHERGLQEMRNRLGLTDEQIIHKFNINDADELMLEYMIRDCIDEGASIIIATSWGHRDVCAKLAPLYPGVIFANATGDKWNDANFTNYFGRMYYPRYLSGLVAGLKTKTGKIGFVAAMGKENSEVTSGVNAFALGVERVNPQARIYVHVTNSWYDPAGERLATRRLLDAGCDVIAQHCNTPDPQIEAEKAGVFGIGFHSDMRRSAPRAVLTSAIWKWGNYYTYLVRSVMDGTFTTRPWVGGLKDGMVDLAPLNPDLTDVAMEEVVAAARAAMEEGALTVFDGPMLTNDGRWIGREGDTLTDDEIFRNMNWYYHTVME